MKADETADADRRALSASLGQQISAVMVARTSETQAREEAEARRALQEEQATARRRMALADLTSFISVVKSEEIERALAERDRLAAALTDAETQAQASALTLARAEAAWEHAATRSLTDAQVLATLRDETPRLAAKIAPLAAQVAALEDQIAELRGAAETRQRQALAQEVWPPLVARLAAWARDGLALLAEQRATRERLYEANAWTFAAAQVDELAISGRRGEDLLAERLTTWLAQAERAGLATATAQEQRP